MSSNTTTDRRPAGDVLDDIFAELDDIKAKLAPYDAEEQSINYTPSGRFRMRLNERQARRLEEINDETHDLRERQAALTKQACRVIAEATTPGGEGR